MLGKDAKLTPNQVKNAIMRTAKDIKAYANSSGAGAMDALDNVKYTGKDPANKGLRPNNIFANAIYSLVKGSPMVWKDPKYAGRNWANYTRDNYTWDSWANFTWDNFT